MLVAFIGLLGLVMACVLSQALYGDMKKVFEAMVIMVLSFVACMLFALAISTAAFGWGTGWWWVSMIICFLSYFSFGRFILIGAAFGVMTSRTPRHPHFWGRW